LNEAGVTCCSKIVVMRHMPVHSKRTLRVSEHAKTPHKAASRPSGFGDFEVSGRRYNPSTIILPVADMPQEIADIKRFIEICRRKDASCKVT